jgi:hypothetical protein
MNRTRVALEGCLLHRAGELAFQFGRYDMYAVLLERLLSRGSIATDNPLRRTLTTRGSSISLLLSAREMPASLQARFLVIEAELQVILERCEVSARNAAHVGSGAEVQIGTRVKADWYDGKRASNGQMRRFIADKERDILEVVSLYIRVANLSREIQLELPRLH